MTNTVLIEQSAKNIKLAEAIVLTALFGSVLLLRRLPFPGAVQSFLAFFFHRESPFSQIVFVLL